MDAKYPESAKKVPSWTVYTEKLAGSSAKATKTAAIFDDILRFCAQLNLPRLGC